MGQHVRRGFAPGHHFAVEPDKPIAVGHRHVNSPACRNIGSSTFITCCNCASTVSAATSRGFVLQHGFVQQPMIVSIDVSQLRCEPVIRPSRNKTPSRRMLSEYKCSEPILFAPDKTGTGPGIRCRPCRRVSVSGPATAFRRALVAVYPLAHQDDFPGQRIRVSRGCCRTVSTGSRRIRRTERVTAGHRTCADQRLVFPGPGLFLLVTQVGDRSMTFSSPTIPRDGVANRFRRACPTRSARWSTK